MSRTPPERTPEQQREADRIAAIRIGTPAAVRAWAERYAVPLIHPEDDETLLITIHEARAALFHGPAKRASLAWLFQNRARIIAAREATRQ